MLDETEISFSTQHSAFNVLDPAEWLHRFLDRSVFLDEGEHPVHVLGYL